MNAPVQISVAVELADEQIDEQLAFLAAASAMDALVAAGELEVEDAINKLAATYGGILCTCNRKMLERWERLWPPRRRR
jgi:hypothetical protein